jgi:hypothetical protein
MIERFQHAVRDTRKVRRMLQSFLQAILFPHLISYSLGKLWQLTKGGRNRR